MGNALKTIASGIILSCCCLAGVAGAASSASEEPPSGGKSLAELFDWLDRHWENVEPKEMEQAAVAGLTQQFGGRILLQEADAGEAEATDALLESPKRYADDCLYLRPNAIEAGLAEAIASRYHTEAESKPPKGIILDLRFVDGLDYRAAGEVAGLFLHEGGSLLGWGETEVRISPDDSPIDRPVAVLINGETSGAAEALTALLRKHGIAVILGSRTAGNPFVFEAIRLKSGVKLRVAREKVYLTSDKPLPEDGVEPDIPVEVDPQDERAYLKDPYQDLTNQGEETNDGTADVAGPPVQGRLESEGAEKPEGPVLHDPTLARAVDLLKGLSLVNQWRAD